MNYYILETKSTSQSWLPQKLEKNPKTALTSLPKRWDLHWFLSTCRTNQPFRLLRLNLPRYQKSITKQCSKTHIYLQCSSNCSQFHETHKKGEIEARQPLESQQLSSRQKTSRRISDWNECLPSYHTIPELPAIHTHTEGTIEADSDSKVIHERECASATMLIGSNNKAQNIRTTTLQAQKSSSWI